jgi:hypothetical protein
MFTEIVFSRHVEIQHTPINITYSDIQITRSGLCPLLRIEVITAGETNER